MKPVPRPLSIDISARTIVRMLAAAFLVYLAFKLFPVIVMLFFSILVAVAFEPVLRYLQRVMSRRAAVFLMALLLGTALCLLVFVIFPPLIEQVQKVIDKIPTYIKWMMEGHSPRSLIHRLGTRILGPESIPDLSTSVSQIMTIGQYAIGTISSLGLFFAFTIYLMLDGHRTYRWLMPYFSVETRFKVEETLAEVSHIVPAYVLGQTIASLVCGTYVFVLLTLTGVPSALMLAALAAVLAVLPYIGFYISLVPILMFALIVSPQTLATVAFFYGLYHLFEGYILLPKIYSQHLRLSGFIVLLSIVVGMTLMGVLGAIALLPIAAAYPVIERIWLAPYLRKAVIPTHSRMDSENDVHPML
ncbi:AI-2E family transporter [Bdellovibrio bacteriovorus]|nr:AI-2E family transporter [Bdellovibrio bacteriovorus]